MRAAAVALLVGAGCLTGDLPDGYPVDAVAELVPLGPEPPSVVGPIEVLGVIRRVGDETHFFTPVQIGDQVIDLDTETATAYAPRDGRFPRIVIALDYFDFRVVACGEMTWR